MYQVSPLEIMSLVWFYAVNQFALWMHVNQGNNVALDEEAIRTLVYDPPPPPLHLSLLLKNY